MSQRYEFPKSFAKLVGQVKDRQKTEDRPVRSTGISSVWPVSRSKVTGPITGCEPA